ncbi:MAG: YegS/Rv2252/BmrU family lipid kinase [Clostridia bacterium]|nr:YegS/Rv2252/BmrU family lipid kinase [Clostridia bacterium]
MCKKLLFILNPHSGKGKIKNKLLDIVDIFVKEGWQVSVHPTQSEKDAYNVVKKIGRDFNMVVVSGGDGTLNEVIRGNMTFPREKRLDIGYIPAGTVNDFASNMNISKNMIKAAENVVNGTRFQCDVGKFNHKSFLYVAAFGAFTNVSYETPQQNKNVLGQLAYFLEGIRQLHALPSYNIKVTCNEEIIEGEFILGMVSNSNRIAGFKTMKAFKAELNDGLFEVLLVKKPKTLFELQDLGTRLLTQDLNTDAIKIFRTSKAKFESDTPVNWTLDGEFGGALREADISVKNNAITLIV